MRPTRTAFLLFVTFLISILVGAQQPPQRDPQAILIIQQSLAAMGGVQLAAIQDSQVAGTIQHSRPDGSLRMHVIIKSKGTKLLRYEVQTQNGTRLRILNRGRAVIHTPAGHVRQLSINNTLAERISHIPILSLLGDWADPAIEIQYVGPANNNGHSADVIALSYAPTVDPAGAALYRSFSRTQFYIDQSTRVLLKTEFKNFAENDSNSSQKVEITYTDYRLVNGVLVPFLQTTYTDGNLGFARNTKPHFMEKLSGHSTIR